VTTSEIHSSCQQQRGISASSEVLLSGLVKCAVGRVGKQHL